MGFLNLQIEAALVGSGEAKPLLQASEPWVLRVSHEAHVIKLHQGTRGGRIMSSVKPINFVEKGGTGCTRDYVTLKLHLVSLLGYQ